MRGCPGLQNAIVGTWQGDAMEVLRFSADGTFAVGDGVRGAYTFPDDTRLRLHDGGDSTTATFDIHDDTLTLALSTQQGLVIRQLHRVRS